MLKELTQKLSVPTLAYSFTFFTKPSNNLEWLYNVTRRRHRKIPGIILKPSDHFSRATHGKLLFYTNAKIYKLQNPYGFCKAKISNYQKLLSIPTGAYATKSTFRRKKVILGFWT